MRYGYEIKDPAREQMAEGFLYYEKKQSGLGVRFLDKVDITIIEITKHPHTYQKKYSHFRTALVKPFPYLIFFSIAGNTVVIYKVVHAQRSPRKYFRSK